MTTSLINGLIMVYLDRFGVTINDVDGCHSQLNKRICKNTPNVFERLVTLKTGAPKSQF